MYSKKKIDDILDWLKTRKSKKIDIRQSTFSKLKEWRFDKKSGNLCHDSNRFFSIIGLEIFTNWGKINHWKQPIIKQSEIGILGIIGKIIDGKWFFLMQAKIEPGNINQVQLSPTFQATKSNYMQVHRGEKPYYCDYFLSNKYEVIFDQLQSEQGSRFIKKRNRNIIIEVEDEVPVYENFRWISLDEIFQLLRIDNILNMDTRTVLSGLLSINNDQKAKSLHTFSSILNWLTRMKTYFELTVKEISLNEVTNWKIKNDRIHHVDEKYFDILPIDIYIEEREVKQWSQPMIYPKQEGICAFIIKRIDGHYHFLVQGKVESGNFDIIEMAPTVQCITGNYRAEDSKSLHYLDYVLNVGSDKVIYDVMQSEEGGRFFNEVNRNMIIEADETVKIETPHNYIWMTLAQIHNFIKFNNFFNIQARSLISAMVLIENEYS